MRDGAAVLIPSHRHTAKDLALWAEYEAADLLHGRSEGLRWKVDQSTRAIREFVAAGSCYCSVSWGKDSVVLAHLVNMAAPSVPLVYLRGVPTSNPDCLIVRNAFLSRFPMPYREVDVVYETVDFLGDDAKQKAGEKLWLDTMRAQGDRYLCGIRADESGGRAIRFRKWGLTGPNCCGPLGWWTARDVFAYLAVNGLPVHPVYAMLGGGRWPREKLRTDELLGARGTWAGRRQHEEEYYGDVLRRLESGS